jgi:hypothetical protein
MKGKAQTVAEPMVLPPLTYGFSVFPEEEKQRRAFR